MKIRRALSVVVTCFFTYFAYRAVRDGSLGVLAHVKAVPLVGAFACLAAGNNVLCALRWWVLQAYRGTPSSAIRRLSESIFFSVVLPTGSVGGDVYRGVQTNAAAPVVADRLIGACVTGVCAATTLPAFLKAPLWASIASGSCAAAAACACGLLVANMRVGPAKVRRAIESLAEVTAPVTRVGFAAALTVGYVLFNAFFLILVGSAVGAHLGLGAALVGSPIVLAAGALPNVHGLSLLQVALVAVLLHAGARHDQAAAAAATQLVGTYLLAICGGLLLLARRIRREPPAVSPRTSEMVSL